MNLALGITLTVALGGIMVGYVVLCMMTLDRLEKPRDKD